MNQVRQSQPFGPTGAEPKDRVRELVRHEHYRCDVRCPDWLGIEVAKWFGLDVSRRRDCMRMTDLPLARFAQLRSCAVE